MAAKLVETGSELLARLGSRASLIGIAPELFGDGPHAGELFEFFGEEGTGKTEMLLHLIVTCTLPKSRKEIQINGPEAKVVFISTDYKFSILRLVFVMERRIAEILRTHMSGCLSDATDEEGPDLEAEVELFVHECLQRLHIIHCNSSWQLFLTLHSLEHQFLSDPNFALLIIDSISMFYWIDRFVGNDNITAQGANIRRITEILKKFVNDFNISVIATKSAIFKQKLVSSLESDNNIRTNGPSTSSSSSNKKPNFYYLDKSWENFVMKRLIFTKDSFQPHKFTIQITHSNVIHFSITESGVEFFK